jgi:hypothetical protein
MKFEFPWKVRNVFTNKLLSHYWEKSAPEGVIKIQVLVLLAFETLYILLASYVLQISLQVRQLSLKIKIFRKITVMLLSAIARKAWWLSYGNFKESGFISQYREILFSATHPGRALELFTGPRTHSVPEPKLRIREPMHSLLYTPPLRDA